MYVYFNRVAFKVYIPIGFCGEGVGGSDDVQAHL